MSSTSNDWYSKTGSGLNISIDGNKACIIGDNDNLYCSNNITSQNNDWTLSN